MMKKVVTAFLSSAVVVKSSVQNFVAVTGSGGYTLNGHHETSTDAFG
jgi:hypothetical protein